MQIYGKAWLTFIAIQCAAVSVVLGAYYGIKTNMIALKDEVHSLERRVQLLEKSLNNPSAPTPVRNGAQEIATASVAPRASATLAALGKSFRPADEAKQSLSDAGYGPLFIRTGHARKILRDIAGYRAWLFVTARRSRRYLRSLECFTFFKSYPPSIPAFVLVGNCTFTGTELSVVVPLPS